MPPPLPVGAKKHVFARFERQNSFLHRQLQNMMVSWTLYQKEAKSDMEIRKIGHCYLDLPIFSMKILDSPEISGFLVHTLFGAGKNFSPFSGVGKVFSKVFERFLR